MGALFNNGSRFSRALRVNTLSSGVLALAGVISLCAGVLAFVTLGETVEDVRVERQTSLERSAGVIASQVELAIRQDEGARVRRFLLDVQASRVFERVTVVVNGEARFSTSQTPDEISADLSRSGSLYDEQSRRFVIVEPLDIEGGEGSMLVASSGAVLEPRSVWSLQVLVGVCAAASLLVMLLGYLTRSQKLTGLFAIRESLAAYVGGERETPMLLVSSRFGPHAAAFNNILEERDELRERAAAEPGTASEHVGPVVAGGSVESSAWGSVPLGLAVIEPGGRVLSINGAARGILGIGGDEGAACVLDEELVGSEISVLIDQLLVHGSGRRRSVELQLGDESSTWVRATLVRLEGEATPRGVLVLEDITQLKHSDEMLNSFIAQATHELRTPLTNIRMYAEEAVDAGSEDEAFRSNAFNMINSESRRLERIVSDMLSVSELEAGSMSVRLGAVHPQTIFEELERDYAPQAEMKGIALSFDLPPKFPVLQADRDRVVQAIHNLLGNALKYTPSGGTVSVGVAFDSADTMSVKVTDSGIGISPEDQVRIFERFCRANDQRIGSISGTGLGLSISREIALMHGGDLTVESQLDHGSTFTLTIPSEAASAANAA